MSSTSVAQFYRSVIDDVVNNVKEAFLDDGIDEQVLIELKQNWEGKLAQTRAVPSEEVPRAHEKESHAHAQRHYNIPVQASAGHNAHAHAHAGIQQISQASGVVQQTVQYQFTTINETGEAEPKTVTLTIPGLNQAALKGNNPVTIALPPHLVGTGGIVMSVPASAAAASLQASGIIPALNSGLISQHHQQDARTVQYQALTAEQLAKQGYTLNVAGPTTTQTNTVPVQISSSGGIIQLDGPIGDTSDEDEDDDEEDFKDDYDQDDEEQNDEENDPAGQDEEPLNTDDDVSGEEPGEVFETDNVIVCQYDKITRSRNKWKFHLKDGIMNLQGRDYVFQKALGDAEW